MPQDTLVQQVRVEFLVNHNHFPVQLFKVQTLFPKISRVDASPFCGKNPFKSPTPRLFGLTLTTDIKIPPNSQTSTRFCFILSHLTNYQKVEDGGRVGGGGWRGRVLP